MNNTTIIFSLFLATVSWGIGAQFDKYKTKTTPRKPPPSENATQVVETLSNTTAQVEVEVPSDITAQAQTATSDTPDATAEETPQRPAATPPESVAPPAPPTTAQAPSPPPRPPSSSNLDSFGRRSSPRVQTEGAGKFVNLNPETAFGPEVVTNFDFKDISLKELTEQMQKLTGINLILDKELKGTVTISAPKAITVGEAWKAYLAALNMNGYSLNKTGAFYKIVQVRDIRYTPTKIYTGNYTPSTANYMMRILHLKHVSAAEVSRSFRNFMSRSGRIMDIRQTNTIIIQDTGDNINRLVRLLRHVDVPGHEESLQIIPIKFASAQEIAKLLDEILQSGGRPARPAPGRRGRGRSRGRSTNISKIIAEPRTNSIIAMANAEGSKQLRELIGKLDVQNVAGNGGQIHVYYLNHGDAKSLSETLTGLVSDAQSTNRQRGGGGAAPPRPRSIFSRGGQESTLFSGPVKITADEDNNALVVTASPTDYLTIKSVIDKLDIPRDQVYVEGLIMETQVSKTRQFGVSVIGAYGTGAAKRAGFQGGDLSENTAPFQKLLSGDVTSIGGLFGGFGLGRTIEITPPGGGTPVKVNSVNGLITAIASNTNANILATPQILALDNTEAIFEVGESVPTITQNVTGSTTTSSVEQQKVTLSLKIKPQINKVTRFVKMEIDQKIHDFSQRSSVTTHGGAATIERNAQTTVVVRDRDTISMGGLMRDSEQTTVSKVPLLGDIPLLGWLFKNKRTSVEKTNLLLFLTPKILANYQRDGANTVKDLLNRRNHHLKDVQGEDDPFKTSVKGLYEKAKEQEEGPLYDESETQEYRDTNEGPGIGENKLQTPDYGAIAKNMGNKNP